MCPSKMVLWVCGSWIMSFLKCMHKITAIWLDFTSFHLIVIYENKLYKIAHFSWFYLVFLCHCKCVTTREMSYWAYIHVFQHSWSHCRLFIKVLQQFDLGLHWLSLWQLLLDRKKLLCRIIVRSDEISVYIKKVTVFLFFHVFGTNIPSINYII